MRLLLAYDGSACADAARDLVARLPLPAGTAITLVTALERGPLAFGAGEFALAPHEAEDAEGQLLADLQTMLREAAEPLRTADRHVDTRVIRGRPASAIVDEAIAIQPDLIVVGSRGMSTIPRLLVGSVARKVLLHAPQSVLVVREARERVRIPERASASERRAITAGAVMAFG